MIIFYFQIGKTFVQDFSDHNDYINQLQRTKQTLLKSQVQVNSLNKKSLKSQRYRLKEYKKEMNQTIKQSSLEQQFTFTVGNITGQGVTLVDKDYNVIQLPKSLLPMGSVSGSIIRMTLRREVEVQRREDEQINALIQKLEAGQRVGDTIIGMEDDLDITPRQVVTQKSEKRGEARQEVKSSIKVTEQIKVEERPQTGMKKKPKIQQAQQKQPKIEQSSSKGQQVQKPVQRQKSSSRRTSSAMKKIKPQSQQGS